MRILRVVISLLFVVTTALYAYFLVTEKIKSDETIPVIKIESELLEVAIDSTTEDLLKGVTAYDEKDGDLTKSVIVESVSNFSEPGVCRVTYAVCDSNSHVATATRKIKYKGYESPKSSRRRLTLTALTRCFWSSSRAFPLRASCLTSSWTG